MDFWRRAARVSRREIMRVKHTVLDGVTLKQLVVWSYEEDARRQVTKKCI